MKHNALSTLKKASASTLALAPIAPAWATGATAPPRKRIHFHFRRLSFITVPFSMAALLGMSFALPATAAPVCPKGKFPASGQTISFPATTNDAGASVPVPDDGAVEAGATLSYVDNGDGTITDRNTLLTWEKKDQGNSAADFNNLHDVDNTYSWSGTGTEETIWDWLDDINTENGVGFAGHSDWRIPDAKELQTIVNYGKSSSPVVSSEFHTNCVAGIDLLNGSCTAAFFYWSSSTFAGVPSSAWGVVFGSGGVGGAIKDGDGRVRAVRAGCL